MFKRTDKSGISIISGRDNKDLTTINKHTGTCFICNKPLDKEYQHHHISRVPPIVVLVHNKCHNIIESDKSGKWDHIKPVYKHRQLRFLKWAYNDRDSLKLINNNIKSANNEMKMLSKRLDMITRKKM